MTAPDNTGLQYNLRQGESLINIYCPDGDQQDIEEDARAKLSVVSNLAAVSAEAASLLRATALAAGLLGATAVSGAPAGQQRPAGNAPGRACEHGPMTFATGTSRKTNKDWKAWDCPAGAPPMGCGRQFLNG